MNVLMRIMIAICDWLERWHAGLERVFFGQSRLEVARQALSVLPDSERYWEQRLAGEPVFLDVRLERCRVCKGQEFVQGRCKKCGFPKEPVVGKVKGETKVLAVPKKGEKWRPNFR